MDKTASEIADTVLEKLSVSPGLAYQALLRRLADRGVGPGIRSILDGKRYVRSLKRSVAAKVPTPGGGYKWKGSPDVGGASGREVINNLISEGETLRNNIPEKFLPRALSMAKDVRNAASDKAGINILKDTFG